MNDLGRLGAQGSTEAAVSTKPLDTEAVAQCQRFQLGGDKVRRACKARSQQSEYRDMAHDIALDDHAKTRAVALERRAGLLGILRLAPLGNDVWGVARRATLRTFNVRPGTTQKGNLRAIVVSLVS